MQKPAASTGTPPGKKPSDLRRFFDELRSEVTPGTLKDPIEKIVLLKVLIRNPMLLIRDRTQHKVIGPVAFVLFAVGAQWLLNKVLEWTHRLVTPPPITIDVEQIVKQFPPEAQDSIRCNLQANIWIEGRTAEESNLQFYVLALFIVCSFLLAFFLRLKFRKHTTLHDITFGRFLRFALYDLGFCLLLCAVLQTVTMLVFPGPYARHSDLFFAASVFIAFLVFPIWHYARLLHEWKVGRLRKAFGLGLPYLLCTFLGMLVVYLPICFFVCDRM